MGKYRLRFKHSLNELVNTENGREARTQCKEYGVNRYVFLIIALYGMLTLGRFMWAYPSFYDMLIKANAYSWLCNNDTINRAIEGLPGHVTCDERDMSVNGILLTVSGSTFMGSIFAAASNIALGSKISALLGSFSMFLGTLLMGFSGESFKLYMPAAIFVGFGMDFIVFPSFNATLLFPNHKLLITSLLTSTISVGMFIPILMKYMVWDLNISFSVMMLTYALLSAALLFILFLLFYPPKRFYDQIEIDNAYQLNQIESQSLETSRTETLKKASRIRRNVNNSPIRRRSSKEVFLSIFGISKDKYDVLKRSILSYHFLLISSIFAIITIASTYYVQITSKLLNQSERTYLSVGIASSFVISIILSPFLDKIGSMYIMWYEVFCLLPGLILIGVPHNCTKLLSILFYSLFTAYSNGQIWLFVVESFDPAINTLILGMLNAMAGIATFSSTSLYQFLLGKYGWITEILICVSILVGAQGVLVSLLHYIKRKHNKIN